MKVRFIFIIGIFMNSLISVSQSTKNIETVNDFSVTLDIKVFLEGPYFNSQMTPFINVLGFLPTSQPYSEFPWNYPGTESVSEIPSFNIIDWVLVDLLKPIEDSNTFEIIGRKAGFVLNNGSITDLNGIDNIVIQSPDTSGFYVRIIHRNHISVISSDSLDNIAGVYSWDFTISQYQCLGNNYAQNEIEPGVWGMISGNGDGNSQIDNKDKNDVWVIQQNSFGYFLGDFDMDSQVTNDDIITKWEPNTGKGNLY